MSATQSAPPPTSSPTPPATSTPPTTTPSTLPPTSSTSPPPPVPVTALPPATPSTPSPAVPSSPPPVTPSTPSPAVPSSPPPATPSVLSPPPSSTSATPSEPSPPAPVNPTTPSDASSSPPPPSSGGRSTPVSNTPPSTSTRSSPPPPTSSSNSDSGSGVSTSLVVGVAVAGAVVLLLFTLFCICCRRKRRRNEHQYYGGPPPPPPPRKDEAYGGGQQQWQLNAPPPSDHAIKIPPPPPHASRPPQLPPPPPPPPPPIFSSGASGSNYSGSGTPLPPPSPGIALGFSKSTFTFQELVRATDGFSDANLLGQGGFGYVHRGMLPNGKEVAVKQLKTGSGQGEREFHAEVEIISRVHHKHLVSLVGYCITGDKRLLVYEFVPNNTMEFHLHGRGRPVMEWPIRLKIALGSAKGLAYLHEDCHPKIFHRDIKSANILLDFKFEAKVADFGLAKFSSDSNTHVSTRVMGTFGYLAPEYASSGKLTEKSDVFSFGVMLLELITGRRPVDPNNAFMDDSLVDWARPLLTRAIEDGNYDTLVDPRLRDNYNPNEMAQMVACAASCVRHSAKRRPRMSQIVRALEGDMNLEDLNEGTRPGHSTVYGSLGSSDYDTGMYNEDMKKFRKLALTSQEYASSEYSHPTSEYGLNPSVSSSEAQTREMEMTKTKNDSRGFL